MKKQLIGLAMGLALSAASLPVFAACPVCPTDPCCDSCKPIYTTAGVVNYNKAQNRTNWTVIKREKQFSDFEKLVKKAGLAQKLDKGNYTVYAPTNTAIRSMNQCTLTELKRPENKDKLVDFVMVHVAEGDQSAYCLCRQASTTNLKCCEYPVDNCNHRLRIGNATVIAPDIKTKNGTVHMIDHVLDPYA